MPVKPDARVKPRRPIDVAVEQETAAALEAGGEGPHAIAAQHARIVELATLDRKHTPEEHDEFKRLVKRWRKRRDRGRQFDRRSEKARAKWAARRGTEWAAKWEQRAIDAARRYDRNLEHGHLTGEQFYWLHKVTGGNTEARNRQREFDRDIADLDAEDAAYLAELAARKARRDEPEAPARRAANPTAPLVDEPLELGDPRPRKRRVGVVAQYDLQGNRVG